MHIVRRAAFALLAAGGLLFLLGAGPDSERSRIALFEPAGPKGDVALTAVLATVADSVELSLDVLQRYDVRRLPPADPAKDLARVRAYCQDNRIDQAILGSGSARPGGGYLFKLAVYDRRADAITLAPEGSSTGALDMFDVTDKLVGTLLDGLSGTHLLFGSLSVETDPTGATVAVNGKEVGTAPLTLRGLPVGTVQLVARTAGREDANASVTIVDGESTDAPLSLARSTGTLALAVPKDAVVAVGSGEIGQKEIMGPGETTLPTGDYEVQARCPGLPGVSARVTISRSASTQWLPWPKGYLDVQAVPAGASILVDGVDRGVAPLVVEVEPGTLHRVELKKDKYEAYRTDVLAVVGDKTSLTPALVQLPGSIRVETSIKDVDVYMDDNAQRAVTPAVFDNVQPGTHIIKIASVRVGKRVLTVGDPIQVEVKPGEITDISRTFVEGKAQLAIKDAPAGSSVTIDGNLVDSEQALTTGVQVPAGVLAVAVTGPGSQKWTDSTFVGAGITTQRSIYSMTWQLARRTITVDGKTDDWAGLLPIWESAQNYNTYPDQPGTQISRGFACRDAKNLYFRYDFSNGSPRLKLTKEFREVLAYSTFLYTKHKGDEVHMNINFSHSLLGDSAATEFFIWNPSTKGYTNLGNSRLTYAIGEGTIEIAVPVEVIKPYLGGVPVEGTLSVANAGRTGNWLSHNATDAQKMDIGS